MPAPSEPARAPRSKRSVLRFVLVFAASLVAFQLLFLFAIAGSAPFARYLELCARAAGALLGWLGQNVYVYENRVTLLPNEFVVTAPCSGLQPMAMLAIAVLAFPSSARAKLAGVGLGVGALFALNLVRIATLCLVQDRWAGAFELFHLALWPMALILCSIALWAAWARRVTRG